MYRIRWGFHESIGWGSWPFVLFCLHIPVFIDSYLCRIILHFHIIDAAVMVYGKSNIIGNDKAVCRDSLPQSISFVCPELSSDLVGRFPGNPFIRHLSLRIQELQMRSRQFLSVCDVLFGDNQVSGPILHSDLFGRPVFIDCKSYVGGIAVAVRRCSLFKAVASSRLQSAH